MFQGIIRNFQRRAGYGLPFAPLAEERQLQCYQVVESQALPRVLQMIPAFGEMYLLQRPTQFSKLRALQYRHRQRIGYFAGPSFAKRFHSLAILASAESLGHRIDGHDTDRMQVVVIEMFPFRIGHLQRVLENRYLAAEHDDITCLQIVGEIALAEESVRIMRRSRRKPE